MDLANAPGEQIFPGELAKALDLIAAGTEIDYVGATAVELVGAGESAGNYQEIEFADGAYSTIGYR
jgi:branched-chain amino acid transport system substrate-binding protein